MQKVFLCYASEDKPYAEAVQLALVTAGYDVFFDQESLAAGDDYHARIYAAIQSCDAFVFLATPNSIAQGKYTLTELKIVRQRWPSPAGRVLAVCASNVAHSDLPSYLTAATVLNTSGNVPAEVRIAVAKLLGNRTRYAIPAVAIAVIAIAIAALAYLAIGDSCPFLKLGVGEASNLVRLAKANEGKPEPGELHYAERLVGMCKGNPYAWYIAAKARYASEKFGMAISDANSGLALDPTEEDARRLRVLKDAALIADNLPAEAERSIRETLRLFPSDSYSRFNLALARVLLSQFPAAETFYRDQIVMPQPSRAAFSYLHIGLSVSRLGQGDSDAALRHFTTAICSEPRLRALFSTPGRVKIDAYDYTPFRVTFDSLTQHTGYAEIRRVATNGTSC